MSLDGYSAPERVETIMKFTYKIKKNFEFLRVFKRGRFSSSTNFTVYCLDNGKGFNRFGVSHAKNYGKSVKRNRVKRLLKESYRLLEESLKTGHDIIFFARRCEAAPDFNQVQKEIKYSLRKLCLFL